MDRNGLDNVMDILVDIFSHLQATEQGVEELRANLAATRTQSPSISRHIVHIAQGWEWSQAQPQPTKQEADLSKAIWEEVVHHMQQLFILVSTTTE